ncbi:DNA methyltransferase, partial [Escherichia coli]|nr:DNA methyltransferase [Escherichia coli]
MVYSERADLEPTTDNLLILGESGDVLEALTRVPELRLKYVGKVRCIYIDPPFNTAQTFANYEDNLEHSVWLTLMRDRLAHMHRLLR